MKYIWTSFAEQRSLFLSWESGELHLQKEQGAWKAKVFSPFSFHFSIKSFALCIQCKFCHLRSMWISSFAVDSFSQCFCLDYCNSVLHTMFAILPQRQQWFTANFNPLNLQCTIIYLHLILSCLIFTLMFHFTCSVVRRSRRIHCQRWGSRDPLSTTSLGLDFGLLLMLWS